MKISISNIIWPKGFDRLEEFFYELSRKKIVAVELALNCFWTEPVEASRNDILLLKNLLKRYQLKLVSIHSLTFTRPDLELFRGSANLNALEDYLFRYFDLARQLDCSNLVFGSPNTRNTYGMPKQNMDQIFLKFLTKINDCSEGVFFNIEPLSTRYCNYLNRFMECVELLENQDFKWIGIQLDIRSILESNEDIQQILRQQNYIHHAHTGNPGMNLLGGIYEKEHRFIALTLRKAKYSKYLTAEILNNEGLQETKFLSEVIDVMREYYE